MYIVISNNRHQVNYYEAYSYLGGDDYVRITSDNNPLVRFNAAVTRQCFQAEIIDDSLLEERENFTFSLRLEPSPLPPLSMVLVDPDVIVIEILDNDCKLTVYYQFWCVWYEVVAWGF